MFCDITIACVINLWSLFIDCSIPVLLEILIKSEIILLADCHSFHKSKLLQTCSWHFHGSFV